jgi:predicted nucleotidyltransferase
MVKEEKKQEENSLDDIKNYSVTTNNQVSNQIPEKVKAEMEKTRKDLDKLKKEILKKYNFTLALGIIPPQANEKLIEEEVEEDLPKEEMEARKKLVHLALIVPDEKVKDVAKIRTEIIQKIKDSKQKIWLHIFTPQMIWEMCMDSKYDIVEALAMSFPLHDKGLLGALRVAAIHKTLVLKKFEKYVVSYIIAGSLVRGDATQNSDVDVYVIINDTDVKRMNRFELKEKLRSIIYSYIMEASELAGVKNKLNVQIYILTEFWESVKDAHPVIFTFIRDGVPLFDQGTFMPWKLLLKMGKLKPSPEAIDMFMSMGDKIEEVIKKRLIDIVVNEVYWGIITPSQALLMLYGVPPPTPKEIVKEMKRVFLEKEKLLEKKYIDILEKVIKMYKDYEHEELKEVKGKEIDVLVVECQDYIKRLKELREQIEKRTNEKTIEQSYEEIIQLLQSAFGKGSEKILVEKFADKIKHGIFPPFALKFLNQIIRIKSEVKKGKASKHEIEEARKNSSSLIGYLTEYNQRCEFVKAEKGRFKIKIKDKIHEIMFAKDEVFFLREKDIMKYSKTKDKFEASSIEELSKFVSEANEIKEIKIENKVFECLRKQFGDYELIL